MKVFITGANGFIGKSLCSKLKNTNFEVSAAVRSLTSLSNHNNINYLSVGDITLKKDWKDLLLGHDCVIHCAGKAHQIDKNQNNSLKNYRLINFETTKKIAKHCADVGVKRLIFLSSVGVLGNNTNNRKPFSNFDKPNPIESYAISKFEAEQALFEISDNTGLEIVVIRPPLVYGPSAPGNLARLIKLVKTGLPLPFGLVNNQRSLIGIENLVDIIIRCIDHLDAKGKTFLVSDGADLSTPNLIKLIGSSIGKTPRFFPMPVSILQLLTKIIGKQRDLDRLIGSLRIDDNNTRKILEWKPAVSIKEGIKRMVQNL